MANYMLIDFPVTSAKGGTLLGCFFKFSPFCFIGKYVVVTSSLPGQGEGVTW